MGREQAWWHDPDTMVVRTISGLGCHLLRHFCNLIQIQLKLVVWLHMLKRGSPWSTCTLPLPTSSSHWPLKCQEQSVPVHSHFCKNWGDACLRSPGKQTPPATSSKGSEWCCNGEMWWQFWGVPAHTDHKTFVHLFLFLTILFCHLKWWQFYYHLWTVFL